MQQVTVHAAKTHLSRLIEAALAGEDVVIARGSAPVVRLVPITKQTFQIGLLAGQLGTVSDFLAPLEDANSINGLPFSRSRLVGGDGFEPPTLSV